MSTENVLAFFQSLGFEEIAIEDGLTALCVEESPDEAYGLLTDENGNLPLSLDEPLVFAFYSAEGAYQWGTEYKNADEFQQVWTHFSSLSEKLAAVREKVILEA